MGDINLEIKIKNLEERTAGEINDTINNIYGTSDQWASKSSWAKDEICIDDNKLWKCLVSNSNKPSEGNEWTQISLKAVANELRTVSDTASQYAYGSVVINDNYSYLKRSGNNFEVKIMVTSPVKNADLIMTLPTNYRPKRQEWGFCIPINGGNVVGRAYLGTDGKLTILIPQNINDSIFIHISFMN